MLILYLLINQEELKAINNSTTILKLFIQTLRIIKNQTKKSCEL
jgi:hypothetical protein